jgi:beta-N-acetylhexosaminidase
MKRWHERNARLVEGAQHQPAVAFMREREQVTNRGVRRWLLAATVGALISSMISNGWPQDPPVQTVVSRPQPAMGRPVDRPTQPSCDNKIASMPPRARLAQLLMVGIEAPDAPTARHAVTEEQVGGVFLRGNSTAPLAGDGLRRLVATSAIPAAVSVDDEGGRVQRIDRLVGGLPSARVMARTLRPDQVRELAKQRGAALRTRGVTMDFAPVADIGNHPDRHVIGDRSFSPDPAVAAEYAAAFAQGLTDSGILPVVKHFPGHGRASGDSHRGVVVTPHLDQLRSADLVPYRTLLTRAPVAVMVGHLVVPGLTDGEPASISPLVYRLLREEYRFDGLAITDDLGGMRAITDRYRLPDAVLAALQAGADIALWSSGDRLTAVLDHLEEALDSGRLPAHRVTQSVRRVLAAKSVCDA